MSLRYVIDLYRILGVDRRATPAEIKAAHHRVTFWCHPDRNKGNPIAEHTFKIVQHAYEVLSDPSRRAAHDAEVDGVLDTAVPPLGLPRSGSSAWAPATPIPLGQVLPADATLAPFVAPTTANTVGAFVAGAAAGAVLTLIVVAISAESTVRRRGGP